MIAAVIEAFRIIEQQPERANKKFSVFASFILIVLTTLFSWTYDRGDKRRASAIDLKLHALSSHIGTCLLISLLGYGLGVLSCLLISLLGYGLGVLSALFLILMSTFGGGNMRTSVYAYILVWIVTMSTVVAPAAALSLEEPYNVFMFCLMLVFVITAAVVLILSYRKSNDHAD